MSKYRVYELAKEFSTTSKVIIDILNRNNILAKNHMSCVDEDAKSALDRTFARKSQIITVKEIIVKEETAGVNPHKGIAAPQQPQNKNLAQQTKTAQQSLGKSTQAGDRTPRTEQRNDKQQTYQQRNNSQPQFRNNWQGQNRPHNQQSQQNQHRQPVQQQAANRLPYQGNQQRPQNNFNRSQGQQPGRVNAVQPGNQANQQQRGQRPDSSNKFNKQGPGKSNAANNQQGQQNSGNNNSNNNFTKGQKPQRNNEFNKKANPRQSQFNKQRAGFQQEAPQVKIEPPKNKLIKMGKSITVKEFAMKTSREVGEIIKKLMMLGVMATINQEIDVETATILGGELNVTVEELPPEEDPTEIQEIEDSPDSLLSRPPVVTVMGHVDHGKTSVLDVIRETNVTSSEAGGITQHIGAYQVMHNGKKIVFLDTPGHEAFTAMRARGAQITDIAILVVAADDGVMPQTVEAINHAKSAKVPIIVAINKMDRPGANPERVKQQMTEYGLVSEKWGGETIMVEVSAHQKTGINELLEMILLVAEIQELKVNPKRAAVGTIIEAELDKGRGTVATVLVQKGTLHIGDSIIAGTAYGKVRAMVNDRGEKVKKAEPSTPVEVLGLSDVPQAGDILYVVDEKTARAVAEKRIAKKRTEEMQQSQKVSLDDLFKHIQDGKIKDLNILVKADVQGSIEALRQAFAGLKNKEVRVTIVHAGVGAVNESDVMLASASNALIIAFNVRPDANARKAAETESVDIQTYRVIYDAINDIEAAMTGMLSPEYKEVVLGRAEVRKVISIPKAVVAGSYVLEGKITSNSQVRIIRNGIVVHEGAIEALRRFKDDVKEVAASFECGISIEKYRDIKEGDIIEAFTMEALKPGN